jgi:hypothetical protein
MPTSWRDLPPDHPIFSTDPSFVFKSDLPQEEEAEYLVGPLTREELLGSRRTSASSSPSDRLAPPTRRHRRRRARLVSDG